MHPLYLWFRYPACQTLVTVPTVLIHALPSSMANPPIFIFRFWRVTGKNNYLLILNHFYQMVAYSALYEILCHWIK